MTCCFSSHWNCACVCACAFFSSYLCLFICLFIRPKFFFKCLWDANISNYTIYYGYGYDRYLPMLRMWMLTLILFLLKPESIHDIASFFIIGSVPTHCLLGNSICERMIVCVNFFFFNCLLNRLIASFW